MEDFKFLNFKKNVEKNLDDARGIAEKISNYIVALAIMKFIAMK